MCRVTLFLLITVFVVSLMLAQGCGSKKSGSTVVMPTNTGTGTATEVKLYIKSHLVSEKIDSTISGLYYMMGFQVEALDNDIELFSLDFVDNASGSLNTGSGISAGIALMGTDIQRFFNSSELLTPLEPVSNATRRVTVTFTTPELIPALTTKDYVLVFQLSNSPINYSEYIATYEFYQSQIVIDSVVARIQGTLTAVLAEDPVTGTNSVGGEIAYYVP